MSTVATCPDDEGLAGLLVSDAEAGDLRLVEHLDHCARCQERLQLIASDAEWQQRIAERLQRSSPRVSDALDAVMRNCLTSSSLESDTTTTGKRAQQPARTTESPILEGKLGRYEVEADVGRGGMGIVYRGFDRGLNRSVAIKVLGPEWIADNEARERFVREGRAVASVESRHIVAVFSVEETNQGWPFLVMEFVDGVTLQQRLNTQGPLPTSEIVHIGVQIATGLADAHACGVVHRDIKPSNILIHAYTGRVKIADFGLAGGITEDRLHGRSSLAGTPEYMAPEQYRREPSDTITDLYMLGGVLYAMCTGRPPFQAPVLKTLAQRIQHEPPIPIEALNPAIPAWLRVIVERLLAKQPVDRFASAEAVVQALEVGESTRPIIITRSKSPTGRVKRHRESFVPHLIGLSFFVLLLVGAGAWSAWRGALPGKNTPEEKPVRQAFDGKKLDFNERRDARGFPRTILVSRLDGTNWQAISLEEALRHSLDQDIITLTGEGPFALPPMTIHGRALTIRAAPGSTPRIVPERVRQGKPGQHLIYSSAPLHLEGLTFTGPVSQDPLELVEPGRLIVYEGTDLRLVGCRFRLPHGSECVRVQGGECTAQQCEFDADNGHGIRWHGIDPHDIHPDHLVLQDCVFTGRVGVSVEWERNATPPLVELLGSTFLTTKGINVARFGVDDQPSTARLRIVARENLFSTSIALVLTPPIYNTVINDGPRPDLHSMILETLVWQGERNHFTRGADYLGVQPLKQNTVLTPVSLPHSLDQWGRFWSQHSEDGYDRNSQELAADESAFRAQLKRLDVEPESRVTPPSH